MKLTKHTLNFYAMRHKETKRWYEFVEYCDDGYGKYEANIHEISGNNLPTFFTEIELANWDKHNNGMPIPSVLDPTARVGNDRPCKRDDVELIPMTLSWEQLDD